MGFLDKLWKGKATSPENTARHGQTGARVAMRNFTAGKVDRLTASWTSTPLTADEITTNQWRLLVARSREQAQSNDYARKFRNLCRTNVVGSEGITLQASVKDPNGEVDKLASESIEDAWYAWGKRGVCDVTGTLSWLQVQNLAIDSAAVDGEFILIMHPGVGPMGFAVQLVDAMRMPVDLKEDFADGRFIRHGIEFNSYGRPLAYYFTTTQENTETPYVWGGQRYVRVEADLVVHGFIPEMISQKRGFPWMATSLFRLKNLGGYEEAALIAARVGAAKMGVITQDPEVHDPDANEGDIITDADPGSFWLAPPGTKVDPFDLSYPSGEFAGFTKASLRGAASGLGVSYNSLANDLEGVNYSSIRQGALDEREVWKAIQAWMIEILCDRVYDYWLRRMLLAEKLRVAGSPLKVERFDKYRAVSWQGRRWSWVDPQADQAAAVSSVQNRHRSRGSVIREQGRDPAEVESELRAEEKEADDRAVQRVLRLNEICKQANAKDKELKLHWSQLITLGGSDTAPGAYLTAVAASNQAANQDSQNQPPAKGTKP